MFRRTSGRIWLFWVASIVALVAAGCGGDSGGSESVEVGACTDVAAFGIASVEEGGQVVDCDSEEAVSEITLVGEDAEGPTACKTTIANIGEDETLVCLKELK